MEFYVIRLKYQGVQIWSYITLNEIKNEQMIQIIFKQS